MGIVFSQGAITMKSLNTNNGFSVSEQTKSVTTAPGTTGSTTIKDVTVPYETSDSTFLYKDYAHDKSLTHDFDITVESLTPAVCSVADEHVVPIAAGTCTVRFSYPSLVVEKTQTITAQGGTVYGAPTALTAGSLREYLYAQQVAALTGVTSGATAQRAGAYANGIDAGLNSEISMSGSYGGHNASNFLVSPTAAALAAGYDQLPTDLLAEIFDGNAGGARWRAWITPHHYITWDGHRSSLRNASSVIDITGEMAVYYSASAWNGALAQFFPAPATLLAKLPNLPSPSDEYLPYDWISLWCRMFHTHTEGNERRWVMPIFQSTSGSRQFAANDPRKPYQRRTADDHMAIGGDSGSPAFCGVNGNLVLVGVTSSLYNPGGNIYNLFLTEIQNAVTALNASGPYSITTVDLSGFTSY